MQNSKAARDQSFAHGTTEGELQAAQPILAALAGPPAWGSAITRLFSGYNQIARYLDDGADTAQRILNDANLKPEGRTKLLDELRAKALMDTGRTVADVQAVYDGAAQAVYAAAIAPQAKGITPQDELHLLNVKADIKMVLDACEDLDQARAQLVLMLGEALAKADSLTVGLLAASNWPALWFRTKGHTGESALLSYMAEIGEKYPQAIPAAITQARALLTKWILPPDAGSNTLREAFHLEKYSLTAMLSLLVFYQGRRCEELVGWVG